MELKEIATIKLRECDLLNERIDTLRKKENDIRLHISNIKKSIEKCIENKQYGFNEKNENVLIEGENKKSKF